MGGTCGSLLSQTALRALQDNVRVARYTHAHRQSVHDISGVQSRLFSINEEIATKRMLMGHESVVVERFMVDP